MVDDQSEVPVGLQVVVSLAGGEVGAEAVAGVVQAEEREVGVGGEEEGSQAVETTSVVQPAVQANPVSWCSSCYLSLVFILNRSDFTTFRLARTRAGVGPLFSRDDPPGHWDCHLLTHQAGHQAGHPPDQGPATQHQRSDQILLIIFFIKYNFPLYCVL